jgi:hypothetical protein
MLSTNKIAKTSSYYSNLLLNTGLVNMILIMCDVYLDSQDSSVSIAVGDRLDGWSLIPSRRDFSSPHHPDWFWGP